VNLERAIASSICAKILDSLSHPSVSLDPAKIRDRAYNGAAVMSSDIAGVQDKLKEISPLVLYTHCYSHFICCCFKQSSGSKKSHWPYKNEAHLFLYHYPKWQRMFELTRHEYLPNSSSNSKLPGLCKTRYRWNDTLAMEFCMRCMRFWLLSWMQYFHYRIIQS